MVLHQNRTKDSDFWACSVDACNRSAKGLHVIYFEELVVESELKIWRYIFVTILLWHRERHL